MSINLQNINYELISEFEKLKKILSYLNELTMLNIEIEDYDVIFVTTKLKHLKCENKIFETKLKHLKCENKIFDVRSTFKFYNFIKSNKKNEFNKIEDIESIINEVMNRLQYTNELIILKDKFFKGK